MLRAPDAGQPASMVQECERSDRIDAGASQEAPPSVEFERYG
jgi:hypothetical protein